MADRKHGALVAATVADVEVGPAQVAGRNQKTVTGVEVVSVSGASPIYFTVDGSVPTVQGDDTYVCQAGGAANVTASGISPITVRLISDAAGVYSVEAFSA